MQSDSDDNSDSASAVNSTYGEKAVNHLSSNQLTAAQYSILSKEVAEYVTRDGEEKTTFVRQVRLSDKKHTSSSNRAAQAFQTIWDGEEVDWDVPESWPKKKQNPRFHVLQVVSPSLSSLTPRSPSPRGPPPRGPLLRSMGSAGPVLRGGGLRGARPLSLSPSPLHVLVLITSQAVRNFFKEQGRIRSTVVKLPGKGANTDWTPLTVCGDIYKEAISDLITDVTGLSPSDANWIAEYSKARSAIYYSLSEEDNEVLEDLCEKWNRSGIPLDQKKK